MPKKEGENINSKPNPAPRNLPKCNAKTKTQRIKLRNTARFGE